MTEFEEATSGPPANPDDSLDLGKTRRMRLEPTGGLKQQTDSMDRTPRDAGPDPAMDDAATDCRPPIQRRPSEGIPRVPLETPRGEKLRASEHPPFSFSVPSTTALPPDEGGARLDLRFSIRPPEPPSSRGERFPR